MKIKPLKDSGVVLYGESEDKRKEGAKKSKHYLKYTVCALLGLSFGLISSNLIELFLLSFLFSAYILLVD